MDVTLGGTADAGSTHTTGRTNGAGGADTLFPAGLGDVDGSAGVLLGCPEREPRAPGLARRPRRRAFAPCRLSRDATADR